MTTTTFSTYASPIGELLLVARGGALGGIYFEGHRRGPSRDAMWRRVDDAFDGARAALDGYFDDPRRSADVALDLSIGTPFQRRVWAALRRIPLGETRSYGELAAALGMPGSARAVGSANAQNPLSILVPCHRVVGADGSLTGYAGGEERKRWLLAHEGALDRRSDGRTSG
jgi:methylated-DNA-[protein]-cysteine S-methyltransferase